MILKRVATALALTLTAAFALTACGEESEQKLTVELDGKGKAAKFTAPASAEPGRAEITFVNNTAEDGELQFIRVEGDHSFEEVVDGLAEATKGKPFPAWFFAGGGVSTTKAGESQTVTQVLQPGTYYASNVEGGPPEPEQLVTIDVSGEISHEALEADTTVTASEYKFDADGLSAGENEIYFENVGAQPHHLLISPLKGDGTVADVEKAFHSEDEEPPLEQKGSQSTTVIEGGESQLVTLDLKSGRYAFYCFISDRQGGPPHAIKGMVDEFEVE